MVSESLARKFTPAGFEQPEGSRHNYTKPRPELQEAFYRWIDELPEAHHISRDTYKKALNYIRGLGKITAREANSLLVGFKPETEGQKVAGLFISACYTHSPEEITIFDVDAPEIDYIGYKPKKGILNRGAVGKYFAYRSSHLSVNNGECGDSFSEGSSGIVVNNSICEEMFAWAFSGFAINNGKCDSSFASWSHGTSVNNGECGNAFAAQSSGTDIIVKEPEGCGVKKEGLRIGPSDLEKVPELKRYVEEISEITRLIRDEDSARRFLEKYGPKPKERIEQDIKEILRKGEFEI